MTWNTHSQTLKSAEIFAQGQHLSIYSGTVIQFTLYKRRFMSALNVLKRKCSCSLQVLFDLKKIFPGFKGTFLLKERFPSGAPVIFRFLNCVHKKGLW